MSNIDLVNKVLSVINEVKGTAFDSENTDVDAYLGGDLGVDSIELLEIWYDLEQALGIRVADSEKRDLYTLEDVINVVVAKQGNSSVNAAGVVVAGR